MATDLPARARVVIVGGGVIGCSVAYHLSKMGWTDIVLLERKQLTSGTTWHAAGLIGQLRQSINMWFRIRGNHRRAYGRIATQCLDGQSFWFDGQRSRAG
jgi:glycine/D-amino acid oxidase-like deaminating enzyme